MGDPSPLSISDRLDVLKLAREIVDSASEDEDLPRPFLQAINLVRPSSDDLADELELRLLQLAQRIIELDPIVAAARAAEAFAESLAAEDPEDPDDQGPQ